MAQILIRQRGKLAELWLDAELIASGPRCAIKRQACEMRQKTNFLIFNVKKDGRVVYVPKIRGDKNGKY